jgi:hypothetical protein
MGIFFADWMNEQRFLQIVQLTSMEEAQLSPTPATIFSLFYNGNFVSTDISSCMDNRFDKVVKAL